ncbi:hypothetical protein NPIL_534281 [Nephila pilipes]|uniref:Uncharacterized protein n=1 Tax=Nephila pilipes TaxID=299642 RepID=A0A8X6Q3Z3_NEPPI|nr:hypothetical protein NPIL_534281 [Nephila pilipes]
MKSELKLIVQELGQTVPGDARMINIKTRIEDIDILVIKSITEDQKTKTDKEHSKLEFERRPEGIRYVCGGEGDQFHFARNWPKDGKKVKCFKDSGSDQIILNKALFPGKPSPRSMQIKNCIGNIVEVETVVLISL